jgi:hypothetical protein
MNLKPLNKMSTNQTPVQVAINPILGRGLGKPNQIPTEWREAKQQKARLDEIEDEMYETLPKKYKDPFMGAYHIAKMLSI